MPMVMWRGIPVALCVAALASAAQAQPSWRGGEGGGGFFPRTVAEIQRQLAAGDPASAEQLSRRMLERARERGGESIPVASGLILLGRSLHLQGRYEEAEAAEKEGVAVCRRVLRDGATVCVRGLSQHALTLSKLGRLVEAETALRQSLAWADELPDEKRPLRVSIVTDAAQVFSDMGQQREAAALLEKALELSEGSSETALRKARAGALHFLGRLQVQQKNLDAAERNLREALRLNTELFGADHRLTARTRFQIGNLLLQLNRPGAVEELRAATEQLIQRAGERVEVTTNAMSMLAMGLEAQGRAGEAESWHRRAVDNARSNGTPLSQARYSQRYGHFLAKQGRLPEAVAAYREGVAAAEKLFAQTRGLPEELRHGVIAQFLQIYRELTSLLLRLHQREPASGHDGEAFSVTALAQSRIFSEMLRQAQVSEYARSARFRNLRSERDRLLDRLGALRQEGTPAEADALAEGGDVSAPAEGARPGRNGRLPELEAALAAAEAALWREFPQYMELVAPRRLDAARVQGLLRPGEAVLSFALLNERSALFVITRERFAVVPLPLGRAAVAARIRDLRSPLEAVAEQGSPDALLSLDPALLHSIYREIFQPASGLLEGISRLIVIGDGPLYTLPLGMLVERYGEEERRRFAADRKAGPPFAEYGPLPYLGDRYRFSYLPSAAALAALREGTAPSSRHAEQLVAFADPRFGKGAGSPAPLRGGLAPLPDTADEVRRIAGLLDGEKTRLLLGEAAQEHAAKQPAMAAARFVVFATHGVLGGEFIEEGGGTMQQPALALSMTGDLRGEDGWLTMREVVEQVRLGAELIVLSACNTAGGAGGGEGFAGLTRAFMYAGARGLVVSHWAVESAATRDLMVEMFRRLRGGADAAAALAGAQAEVRAPAAAAAGQTPSRAHPFFWAPFVFVGD